MKPMKMKAVSLVRAKKINMALQSSYGKTESMKIIIIDTLADIRHLCDLKGLNFGDLDRIAYRHYCAEIAGRS